MIKKIVRLLIVTSGTFTFLANIISGVSLAEETKSAEFNFKKYDFWVNKCQLFRKDKQYSEALNACEQAISLKPKKDNIQLWLARGDSLLQLGQYREAAISYDWVLKQDKKNVPALVQKCSALLSLGKHKDALESCDLALGLDKYEDEFQSCDLISERRETWDNIKQVKNYWGNITLAKALYNKGSVFRRKEEYEEATKCFDDAIEQDSNFALAYAGKCGVLADQKDYKEAEKTCKKAIKKFNNPQSTDESTDEQTDESVKKTINKADASDAIIWYETGRVKQKLNKQAEALNNFNLAIQINPRYSQALARKSDIFNKMERYQEALDNCDRALKGDKQWSDTRGLAYVWYQRSAALLGLQKYNEALASSENAIAVEPKYAEAWNNKAVSLWHLGQYEAAKTAIEFALENDSNYTQAGFNRVRILTSIAQNIDLSEDKSKIIKAYQQAIDDYTSLGKNINSLDRKSLHVFWLNKAVAQMNLDKYQDAQKSIENSIKSGNSFAAYYNQAIILSRLGNYKNAIKSFNKANQFVPDNYLVLTGKAIALTNLGKLESYENAQNTFQNALKTIDRALAINPSYKLAIENRQKLIKEMEKKVDRGVKVRNLIKN